MLCCTCDVQRTYYQQQQAKAIIALNKFNDGDYSCEDKDVLDVLSYYSISRDETEA